MSTVDISDISEYQGNIDWSKVPADVGIYHRLWAWRSGEQRRDAKVDYNVANSGVDRLEGGYLRVDPSKTSSSQAAALLYSECGRHDLLRDECLRPAIDIEPIDDAKADSSVDWPRWTRGFFMAWVALTGTPLRVYSSGSFFDSLLGGVDDWPGWVDCWVAHTGVPVPAFTKRAKLHQFSFTGRRPGIVGNVDMDRSMPGVTVDDLIIKKKGGSVARPMILSPSRSSRNGAIVRLVAVHTAEGSQNKESLGAFFGNAANEASSHSGVDALGIVDYVPFAEKAWTLLNGNPISDNVELCAFASMTRAQWMSVADVTYYHTELKRNVTVTSPLMLLQRTADWIRERCDARGIPKVKISAAEIKAGKSGVIGHYDWTLTGDGSHTDPGAGFPWDYVMNLVGGNTVDGFTDADRVMLTRINSFLSVTADAPVNNESGKRETIFDAIWNVDEATAQELAPAFKTLLDAIKAIPVGGSGSGGSLTLADVKAAVRAELDRTMLVTGNSPLRVAPDANL